jgi:hypothetical protein
MRAVRRRCTVCCIYFAQFAFARINRKTGPLGTCKSSSKAERSLACRTYREYSIVPWVVCGVTPGIVISEKTPDSHLRGPSTLFSQAALHENEGDCDPPVDASEIDRLQGKSFECQGRSSCFASPTNCLLMRAFTAPWWLMGCDSCT